MLLLELHICLIKNGLLESTCMCDSNVCTIQLRKCMFPSTIPVPLSFFKQLLIIFLISIHNSFQLNSWISNYQVTKNMIMMNVK